MATHDYDIANQSGAAFRTDLNNALAAIQSNNSNSSSPATTVAYQWWADTSAGTLKIRNAANNAWIELFQLDGTLTLEDGTVSEPALAARNDLNTGVFFPATDKIAFATGGVERLELGDTTIFNEDGADVDFRIEGDSVVNMFYVDAGNNRIGFGTDSPTNFIHAVTTDTTVAKFESTASGGSGVELVLVHNSSSPADNDNIGAIYFQADHDGGSNHTFAYIIATATDVSDGSEDANITMSTSTAGTATQKFRLNDEGISLTNLSSGGGVALDVNSSVASSKFCQVGMNANRTGHFDTLGNIVQSWNSDSVSQVSFIAGDDTSNKDNGKVAIFTQPNNSSGLQYRLIVDEDGLVGIGTTTPLFTLHLDSQGSTTTIQIDSDTESSIKFNDHGGSAKAYRLGTNINGNDGQLTIYDDTRSAEVARFATDGKLLMGTTGSLDLGLGPQVLSVRGGNSAGYDGTAAAIFGQLDNDAATCIFYNASDTNGTNMLDTRCVRTNNSAYTFHIMRSNSASDTEFRFRGDGNGFCDGSFSGGGADYAEYFEWSDGNSSDEDRRGYTVVLDGNKIRKSTSSDAATTIIGVVSSNPSIIGDGDLDKWKQKYKKDDYGTYLRDSNGERVLNSDWDESIEYVSREDRKEWSTVGLMGKIRIRKGQTMGTNWIKMQDISDTVEEWLVR